MKITFMMTFLNSTWLQDKASFERCATGELFFQPPVQKWKGADTIDLVRTLKSRELNAIPGAEPAIHLPHPLKLLAREIDVDRVVFRARFDYQGSGSDHPREFRVAEAGEQIRQIVLGTMNARDKGRGNGFALGMRQLLGPVVEPAGNH